MSLKKYMILPLIIGFVAVAYWYVSGFEAAGSVLLLVFAATMALFGWTLVPTAPNEGPTAPVDPDFEHPRH
jgi:hypothetical protein